MEETPSDAPALCFVFLILQLISAELRSSKHWELTEEGTEIAEQGSHEARVFSSIPLEGLAQSELMVRRTQEGTGGNAVIIQK